MDALPNHIWDVILECNTSAELGRFGASSKNARAVAENRAFVSLRAFLSNNTARHPRFDGRSCLCVWPPLPTIGEIIRKESASDDSNAPLKPLSHQLYLAETAEARLLWKDADDTFKRSEIVGYESCVGCLRLALEHYETSTDARRFAECHLGHILSILLRQRFLLSPQLDLIEQCLETATSIISADLRRWQHSRKNECKLLNVLATIFYKSLAFYKCGYDEVRARMVDRFRKERGFSRLAEYLAANVGTHLQSQSPSLDAMRVLLSVLSLHLQWQDKAMCTKVLADAHSVSRAVMEFLSSPRGKELAGTDSTASVGIICSNIQLISERLSSTKSGSSLPCQETKAVEH